jgi:hypothetical protein
MPEYALGELFTEEAIDRAYTAYVQAKSKGDRPNAALAAVVREHALEAINAKTGQENDARYLAYLLEYVFDQHNGATSEKTMV